MQIIHAGVKSILAESGCDLQVAVAQLNCFNTQRVYPHEYPAVVEISIGQNVGLIGLAADNALRVVAAQADIPVDARRQFFSLCLRPDAKQYTDQEAEHEAAKNFIGVQPL